ncbi:hypothetical protein D3C87_1152500 [compost metagenome]
MEISIKFRNLFQQSTLIFRTDSQHLGVFYSANRKFCGAARGKSHKITDPPVFYRKVYGLLGPILFKITQLYTAFSNEEFFITALTFC